MTIHCLLLSLTLCHALHDRPVMFMMGAQSAMAFADTTNTLSFKAAVGRENAIFFERDPLVRPFIYHAPAAYAEDAVETFGLVYIAERMRRSRNKWARRLWWGPQAAQMALNIGGLATTGMRR